jgi:hypothetical protein
VGPYIGHVACMEPAVISQYTAYHAKPRLLWLVDFMNSQTERTHSSAAMGHERIGPGHKLISILVYMASNRDGRLRTMRRWKDRHKIILLGNSRCGSTEIFWSKNGGRSFKRRLMSSSSLMAFP